MEPEMYNQEEILEAQNQPQEPPINSVFHPDNIGPVTVIQLTRLYDAVMALLAIADPEKAIKMAEAHAKGITLTPAPAFTEED
jgi:hypothetical protein